MEDVLTHQITNSKTEHGNVLIMIPKIFHRTVRETGVLPYEDYWWMFQQLHKGWEFHTYTGGDIYMSGFTRLLALYRYGGIYVDWDIEPYQSWEPLLSHSLFIAPDYEGLLTDAIIGAEPHHPLIWECLQNATHRMAQGGSVMDCGPFNVNDVLRNRYDVDILDTNLFYQMFWNNPARYNPDRSIAYGVSHNAESWFQDVGGVNYKNMWSR